MTWGMTAVAGATLVSGAMGSSAAKEAAGISAAGAREAALVNKQMFDITNEQQAPYRQAGYTALKDMATQQPYLTSNFTAEDFAKGIDPDELDEAGEIVELANLGYCELFDFKCAGGRTCDAWIVNGPLKD